MEEIDATNTKYQPLQVLWHPFMYLRACPLAPIHSFTTFIVARIVHLKLVHDLYTGALQTLPSHQKHFHMRITFF